MLKKDETRGRAQPEIRLKELKCNRTGRWFSPEEHARCPYCFGTEADVKRGSHAEFCDYREGVDPPTFGRPDDAGRYTAG